MNPARPDAREPATFPPGFDPLAPAGVYTASLGPIGGTEDPVQPAERLSARALAWSTLGVRMLAVAAGVYGLGSLMLGLYAIGLSKDSNGVINLAGFNMLGAAALWWGVLESAREIASRSSSDSLSTLRTVAWWCRGILFCLGWTALLPMALFVGVFALVYLIPVSIVGGAAAGVLYLAVMFVGRSKEK